MKKFYTMLAMAFAGATAFAAMPVSNAPQSANAELCKEISTMMTASGSMSLKPAQAPAKAVATRDDLVGPHTMTYIWGLKGDDPYGGALSPYFYAGNLPNEIVIVGMPYTDVEIVATVDMEAKTLSIAKQEGWYHPNYDEMVYITPMEWTSNTTVGEKTNVVATIAEDGTITFPETDIICAKVSQGYFFFFYNMVFEPLKYVEIDESEYTPCGNSVFDDYLVNHFVTPEYQVAPQEVETLVNADRNVFILKNPYGSAAWQQVNGGFQIGKQNGNLYVDITDPECVLLRPLVHSGLWEDEGEDGQVDWQEYLPYNDEGYMYFIEGYDTDEIWMEFAAVEAPLSTYDAETGIVEIVNLWFGITDSPLGKYYYPETDAAGDKINVQKYTIKLPDLGAVNTISSDNNGVKRYFNLQGMEVKNPAAGQIVIVKDGNKTSKTIVR